MTSESAILTLIADLFQQNAALREENLRLQQQVAALEKTQPPVEPPQV